jgi:Xaa-Pro aminopeptidase
VHKLTSFDFAAAGLDALLVTNLHNVRYLTAFTGSNAACLVTPEETVLFTDPRYTIQAKQEFAGGEVRIMAKTRLMAIAALEFVGKRKGIRIGFDPGDVTVSAMAEIEKRMPAGGKLVAAPGVVEAQRMVKDAAELDLIRRSCLTNSAAFDATVKKLKPSMREADVAAELEYQQRKRGASGPAFETIVAAGPRTALPHARPTGGRLGENVLLLIDMGAVRDGYASDMTRMLSLGKVSKEIRGWYAAVLEAQLAALDAVRAGTTTGAVDRAARNVLKAKGLDKLFTHSTGHGLGLEIHEQPWVRAKDKTRLQAGMVITIEPGVYVEGVGGIRIEDTVAVTKTGCEILTPTTKEFFQI